MCSWDKIQGTQEDHQPHATRHALRAGPNRLLLIVVYTPTGGTMPVVAPRMASDGMLAAACQLPQFQPNTIECNQTLTAAQDLHFPCHMRVRFPVCNPEEHLQVDAMIDSGNWVPGSTIISEAFLRAGPAYPYQHAHLNSQ